MNRHVFVLLAAAVSIVGSLAARAEEGVVVMGGQGMWAAPPPAPHLVIRAPGTTRATHEHGAVHHGQDADLEHGDHHGRHDHRVAIPGAVTQPVWRQPYSYGYFGASPKGHWQRHFGYHRAYTQWTRK